MRRRPPGSRIWFSARTHSLHNTNFLLEFDISISSTYLPTYSSTYPFLHAFLHIFLLNPFEQFLTPPTYYNHEPEARVDEYKEYNKLRPAPAENALHWWRDHAQIWPNMARMAFDLLSIPAMSAECERVFSQAKLLITTQRNRLGDSIIDAVECLKHWYKVRAFE